MTIGEIIGLASGIVIPLAALIVGGFWAMNNRISGIEQCLGEQKIKTNDMEKACMERHENVDRRLERIDNWKEGKGT